MDSIKGIRFFMDNSYIKGIEFLIKGIVVEKILHG